MHKNLVSEIGYTASVYDFNGVHINDAIDRLCEDMFNFKDERNDPFYKYFLKYTDVGLLRYIMDGPNHRDVL